MTTKLETRDVLTTLQKLPLVVAVTKDEAAKLGIDGPYLIHRGVSGYDPRPGFTDAQCAWVNRNVTPAQIEAMQVGSMFGWEVPGADPDTYPLTKT